MSMLNGCSMSTGEADNGVEDEYQLEDLEVTSADYMLKVGVSNFKNAWESMGDECEKVDEYGLGVRESLKEAVSAVIDILGMQPCEGTDSVPNNSRSHTCLLSGLFIGNAKVLVRLSFGIDGPKQVAMKLAVRSEDQEVQGGTSSIVSDEASKAIIAAKKKSRRKTDADLGAVVHTQSMKLPSSHQSDLKDKSQRPSTKASEYVHGVLSLPSAAPHAPPKQPN